MKKLSENKFLQTSAIGVVVLSYVVFCLLSPQNLPARVSPEVAQVDAALEQHNIALEEGSRLRFAKRLVELSHRNGFDPLLILAIMQVESQFKIEAVSERGAMGLLQLKPVAAKEVSRQFDVSFVSHHELLDPFKNMVLGIYYLKSLQKLFGQNWSKILTAYNIGPTAAKNVKNPSQKYFQKVMRAYQELQEI